MTIAETIALVAAAISLCSVAAAWVAIWANRSMAADNRHTQVNIGARNSRASVVSANRQRWIDAIRDDVAALIALRARREGVRSAGSFNPTGQDALLAEDREVRTSSLMLRTRVELRLNLSEPDHIALVRAMQDFERDRTDEAEEALKAVSRKIFKDEWTRLKNEASGTDPFVKEGLR